MRLLLVLLVAAFVDAHPSPFPAGKCKYPLPSNPGFNVSTLDGQLFQYIYTPTSMMFKAVDSIVLKLKKIPNQENIYSERIRARSFFNTVTNIRFRVRDEGDGILERITKDGDPGFTAVIVDMKENVAMFYVCSKNSTNVNEDYLFVAAQKSVKPDKVKKPEFLFRETFEKWNFTANFHKMKNSKKVEEEVEV